MRVGLLLEAGEFQFQHDPLPREIALVSVGLDFGTDDRLVAGPVLAPRLALVGVGNQEETAAPSPSLPRE